LTYRLGSEVGVAVLVLEIFFGVGHVLGSVNFVELSLAIGDLKGISSGVLAELTEVSTHEGTVLVGVVVVEGALESVGGGEEGKSSPSEGHASELGHAGNDLEAEESTGGQSEVAGTVVSVPETGEVLAILEVQVGGKEESEGTLVNPSVVPLETIILCSPGLEPGST